MPVAPQKHDPHIRRRRPDSAATSIFRLPSDPRLTELLAQAHLIAERHEEDRAITFLHELLNHKALPMNALRELRYDMLMLELRLHHRLTELRILDPGLRDYRTASTHLDLVCLHQAGRELDQALPEDAAPLPIALA